MNDREEFLNWVHTSLARAERAMFNGDDGPRRAIWSSEEPVSVLGAWRNATNRGELVEAFDAVASSFSNCTDYSVDVITFDVRGDMAYTVGYERVATSMDGAAEELHAAGNSGVPPRERRVAGRAPARRLDLVGGMTQARTLG